MPYNKAKIAELADALLKELNIDPRTAADSSGIHRATVYGILRGDKVARETLIKFAKLGGRVNEFMVAADYSLEGDVTLIEATDLLLRKYADKIPPATAEIMRQAVKDCVEGHQGEL